MCVRADRCGTLLLPYLYLLPCYGRTTVMMVPVIGIVIVVCCLLLLMMMMMMVCLLAAAAAAVAAAYIGGNISYLHVPCLTSGRYITLHYPLAAVYVACLFSCLMTRYMSR